MGKILETLVSTPTESLSEQCEATNPINLDDEYIIEPNETNQNVVETNISDSSEPKTNSTNNDLEPDFVKNSLTLNLDDEAIPKNKKFLDLSEDLIVNQFFSQTIAITPSTEDDYIDRTFSPNNSSNSTSVVAVEAIDFFTQKVEEDDITYTDTVDNYQEQENEANMCSLNDNFNENYCSFSSIDYQPVADKENANNEKTEQETTEEETEINNENEISDDYENCLMTEHFKHQRPSIIIDCYDDEEIVKSDNELKDSSNSEIKSNNNSQEDQNIKDYCFYFDQTIEEDDDEVNDIVFLEGANVEISEKDPDPEPKFAEEPNKSFDEITDSSLKADNEVEIEIQVEDCPAAGLEETEISCEEDEIEESGVSNENCVKVLVSFPICCFERFMKFDPLTDSLQTIFFCVENSVDRIATLNYI